MKGFSILLPAVVLVSAIVLGAFIGCSGSGEKGPSGTPSAAGTQSGQSSAADDRERVITIGNLSDLTGLTSNAQVLINLSLADVVDYYNRAGLIPGVKLEVLTYDGQYDMSKTIPSYEWLIGRGADFIFTSVPGVPITLKSRVDQDHIVLFAATANLEDLSPPGYLFSLGTIPQYEAFTLLKWIAQNHWDYHNKGPAKLGMAAWNDGYSGTIMEALKEYARAHPDQFVWCGGGLTNFAITWGPEVEATRNCDYVFPPAIMMNFVQEYRAGGGRGTFIGTDPQTAFLGLIRDAELFDEIDGMLFVRASRWWNEEGTLINLTKEVLYQRHPEKADGIVRSGVGYITFGNLYMMLDAVRQTVAEVGTENFDSEALYHTLQSYSITIDGVEMASFSPAKRFATNYYGIYRADGKAQDLFRADPDWLPQATAP